MVHDVFGIGHALRQGLIAYVYGIFTSLLEFRLVADETIFLLFLSGFGLSYCTHGEWVFSIAIQGFGVGESQGVAILPFLGVIHFDVGDGSSVVVVDDDFLLLPVAFTRSEDDGSCILEHGDEIGHHDGLSVRSPQ